MPATRGARIAEFGAGVGAASLALLSRVPDTDATVFEIDPALCALARENIARNGFAGRARACEHDVGTPLAGRFDHLLPFDHVLMNPPFNDDGRQPSPDPARRAAHAADAALLPRWIAAAAAALREGGTLTLIWRADGLGCVLRALAESFGAVAVTPVYPGPDRPAIRMIASALKGARAPLRLNPPLTLNDAAQRPTPQAEAILRNGEALPMS